MALGSLQDNSQNAFVESPTRTGKTAVEVTGEIAVTIDTTGLATEVKQDSQITEAQSTNTKLDSILTEVSQKTEPTDAQNIRDLQFSTDKVDVSGSEIKLDSTSLAALENISVTVTSIGEVEIKNDSGSPIPITSTDLDIRNLSFASDKVDATGSVVGLDSTSLTAIENITATIDDGIDVKADYTTSFSPDPSAYNSGQTSLKTDGANRLETHSSVLTDEGSFRDDFPGSSLNTTLTGTITFTNNSNQITGSGTFFTTELKSRQYIKKTTDSETLYVRIDSVVSDTVLILEADYTGTTETTTGHVSNWKTVTSGGSFGVANSILTLGGGTTGTTVSLYRDADYGPFTVSYKFSISQRIANQTIVVGVRTPITSPDKCAEFRFTGTDNTQVTCISCSSSNAADLQSTTVTLPNNLTSASSIEYIINVSNDQITFVIAGIAVASHRDRVVGAYDFLQSVIQCSSTAVVTNTNINLDWHNFYNVNQVEIANNFLGEPLIISPIQTTERLVSTYSAGSAAFAAAATATDIFTIVGSATKVVRVKRILISASATNPTSANIFIIKRSTANTGGTSAVLTGVPNDSDDSAATAVCRTYTANPTLGTTVGNIRSFKLVIPQKTPLGGVSQAQPIDFYFGNNSNKSIVLRGTSEALSINLGSTTITGNSFCITIEWTEE